MEAFWQLFNRFKFTQSVKSERASVQSIKNTFIVHITVLKIQFCCILCCLKEGMAPLLLCSLLLFFKMFMFWRIEVHPWFSLQREYNRKNNNLPSATFMDPISLHTEKISSINLHAQYITHKEWRYKNTVPHQTLFNAYGHTRICITKVFDERQIARVALYPFPRVNKG